MKIFFVSLGCDKNLVDSEKMLSLLYKEGFELTDEEDQAEVIVINTCCFIHDAKEESIETIIEMGKWKEEGSCKALIIAGCLAQRYHDEMKEELPEVDGIIGTTALEEIVPVVRSILAGQKEKRLTDIDYLPKNLTGRINITGGYTSYLKIAEGCDKFCTYCIIPKLRGHYRSVPMEELLEEAKQLAENGTVELILVAQETTIYGTDLYNENKLPELLHELCKIEGFKMIRLLYCYPEEITPEFIEVMKSEEKICHYVDMPIQHCSDTILKKMGRRTSRKELTDVITRLRQEIPDIAIRTTLITGFPSETLEQHEECKRFIQQMKFDRLGVFTYSAEEDTPAAKMEEQVPEEIKESRRNELMEIQQQIAFENNKKQIGKQMDVLVEGMLPDEGVYVGRTYMDAPNVDGFVFFEASSELLSGSVISVKITEAKEYDLIGIMEG